MNNANKKILLISDYFNLYLITLFIIFIKPKLFSDYLEFERKRLTDEEFENLKQVYFSKTKNKLAEKDRKIDQQQLYKEDFYKNPYSTGSIDWILVDSSKYDKLSNKDDK